MNINVPIHIPTQTIADLVTTAFEGGSNYWIHSIEYMQNPEGFQPPAYSDVLFYEQQARNLIKIVDNSDMKAFALTDQVIAEGFKRLATKFPDRIASVLAEDADAEDADVWLQLCLFGEVVYG